ncbi:excisionase family DNA-binding protein [Streptomyces sp. NPDC015684]|uniref:excisionase family DNA-binding protein n=1 Tax=Streptomyces sp. NPDC015684 TaxID=3364963 RepID=UPI0036FA1115
MSITDLNRVRPSEANGLAPVLLTVEEAARCLRIGRTTCFALIRSGELESLLIGGLRRVPADAPAAFLARRRAERQAA